MYDIYLKVREDYLIVMDNMQELICKARPENVAYYNKQYNKYMCKLIWLNKKIDKVWH